MRITKTAMGVQIETAAGVALPIRHIIGIGLNYAAHAKETGKGVPERPVLFSKNPFSACLHGDPIVIPRICQDRPQVDFEAELGVVIGTQPDGTMVRDVPVDRALACVAAYVCVNDVSARWWQKDGSGGQFNRGKSFDTFCPIGPAAVAPSQVGDPQSLRIRCLVNGHVMQDSTTADMIFPVATLISEISRGTTLLPGTLIVTGTPSGVGFARSPQVFLKHGDRVEVEIERIGTLVNQVVEEGR